MTPMIHVVFLDSNILQFSLSMTSTSPTGHQCCPVLSLADDELSQIRLREAPQLLQRVVLWHQQAGDVQRQLGERDAGRGRIALLQAQHHTQDVGHTLRHLCREGQGSVR